MPRVNQLKSIENKGCFKLAVKADMAGQVSRWTATCMEMGCSLLVSSGSFLVALAALLFASREEIIGRIEI